MTRNQITTVADLKAGDRFYKQSSKNKKVLHFIGGGLSTAFLRSARLRR
ncbi:hypothetical protein CLV32_3029 [Pedobacter duraquae]|uniref:Uncharacterized protein n=1 Tax=Pedobacter duraquae TaxID=425511 RepID=A0A4R6IIX2_9SPHI|nr:hypothetical protein CLV32_3029 [Pedobacter duraquae]